MSSPFARGLAEISTGRRTLLKAAAAGVAISALPLSSAEASTTARRCYVLVLDGCRPEELDLGITPHLTGLRDGGLRLPRALSQPIMETIPNHVMMMTGVHPERSGVPANSIFDGTQVRDMDRETDIVAPTVIELLNAAGLTTGTVLSKEYLYGVFGGRATYRWEPQLPYNPITGHQADLLTEPAARTMMERQDPHLMFVNLGDIDRVGHADLTTIVGSLLGQPSALPLARRAALTATDQLVGSFVQAVKDAGHWDQTLMIVLADHAMDWSAPDKVVSLSGVIDEIAPGSYEIAQNGGADLIYWTGPTGQRAAKLAEIRTAVEATDGVLAVHTPAELRLGGPCGDLIAYARAGWRLSDPTPVSNPIPGNHGHPATRPIPFFLAGGAVAPGVTPRAASTLDVAPTVAAYFGVNPPPGGWQGFTCI